MSGARLLREGQQRRCARPLSTVLLSRVKASLSCLANLGAWPLLLYLSTSNQLLSHGAKNSSTQEGSQRKTAWRAGSGPAASSKQVFALLGGSGNVYSAGQGWGSHSSWPSQGTGRGRGLQWTSTAALDSAISAWKHPSIHLTPAHRHPTSLWPSADSG